MLLVDDDQAKVAEGQEQGRAGADHNAGLAESDGAPGAGAHLRADVGMPFGRQGSETLGEALEKGPGQRDFRHQDQRLPAGSQRIGHSFEIDLRLARAGDAVDQRHAVVRRLAQAGDGGGLVGRELDGIEIGIGRPKRPAGGQLHFGQRTGGHQSFDHGGGDARRRREASTRPGLSLVLVEQCQDPAAGVGEALRRRARRHKAAKRRLRFQRIRRPQHHAHHHAARRQRVAGDPVDEGEHLRRQRRCVEGDLDGAQPVR